MSLAIKTTGVLTLVTFVLAIPLVNQMLFVLMLSFFLGLLSWHIAFKVSYYDTWMANIAFLATFCGTAYYVSVELLELF
jgi:hypothetical protein